MPNRIILLSNTLAFKTKTFNIYEERNRVKSCGKLLSPIPQSLSDWIERSQRQYIY